jgi:hypothetical protein
MTRSARKKPLAWVAGGFFHPVEMSGIEPESERLDPRMSTSVASYFVSPSGSQPAEISPWLTAGTRKPLFRKVSGVALAALRLCVARLFLRQEIGVGGRVLHNEDQLPSQSLMQRGEEQHSLVCDWHLCFALISRGRRLSARNSGPASPVETVHPRLHNGVIILLGYGNDTRILYVILFWPRAKQGNRLSQVLKPICFAPSK